jgi:hypothetical protein
LLISGFCNKTRRGRRDIVKLPPSTSVRSARDGFQADYLLLRITRRIPARIIACTSRIFLYIQNMNITFSFLNSWRPTPRGRSGTCRSSFEGRAWSIQNVSDWGRACFTSQTRPPSAMTAGSVQVRREPPVLRGTLPRLFLTPFMSLAMRQQPGHPIPARSIDADGVARHQGRQRFGLWACLGAWGAGTAGPSPHPGTPIHPSSGWMSVLEKGPGRLEFLGSAPESGSRCCCPTACCTPDGSWNLCVLVAVS